MIGPRDVRKVGRYGLLGALGCLVGWLIGEPVLALTLPDAEVGGAPSLVSRSSSAAPSPEFAARLTERNAQTGDIQISLIWDNRHDLDLHCLPPAPDEEIWFERKGPSRSGGQLDVDTNAGCERDVTDRAVENIFWPTGKAPNGEYRVFVNFYTVCPKDVTFAPDGGEIETTYRLSVLASGKRQEMAGKIRFNRSNVAARKVEVYRFVVGPSLSLLAPAKVHFASSSTVKVPFQIDRSGMTGPVTVRAEGLPAGLEAEPVVLDDDDTQGEIAIAGGSPGTSGPIQLVATSGRYTDQASVELGYIEAAGWSWLLILVLGIWTALLAAGLAAALIGGQNQSFGRPMLAGGLPKASAGAAAAGFVSGAIGQTLLFLFAFLGLSGLGFLAGWALLGTLLGYGVSFFIPNLDRKRAMYAGLAGGVVAALGFLLFSLAADWLGRVVGSALLGLCIGLMVALVETAFRSAWLEVIFGPRETVTVNLGPEPIMIGSDAHNCTVFARGAAKFALRYWIRNGEVICHDMVAGKEQTVRAGDRRSAGTVTVVVCSGSASPAPAPAPSPTSRPVPVSASPPAPAPSPSVRPSEPSAPRPAPPSIRLPDPREPSTPRAPLPKPAPPAPGAMSPPSAASDQCPICHRKAANRYCLVCERKF